MPTPSYSPTDYGTAVGALALMALDVLTATGVVPALDAPSRTALITSTTFLSGLLIAAYVANRRVKHQTAAVVAAAQVAAVPPAAAPISTAGATSSTFVLPTTPNP